VPLGSFVPVYATVEKNDTLFQAFANRAHNDLAELLLLGRVPPAAWHGSAGDPLPFGGPGWMKSGAAKFSGRTIGSKQ
jgi:hypothetical protein